MNFRKDINGLRALAVAAVVLYHFNVPGFSGGYAGVDVFFVISGFLMTGLIMGRMDRDQFSLLAFYLDRTKRIVPALLVMCGAVLAAGWFLLPPSEYASLGSHVAGAVSFISNFLFFRESGYFAANAHEKWVLHTWSLSVEWQFYLLYPVVVLALRRWLAHSRVRPVLVVMTLLSLVLCVVLTMYWENAAFYLLPARAWEMLAGGLVYLYGTRMAPRRAQLLELAGIGMIVYAIFAFDGHLSWPGAFALLPVAGAAMVIAAARQESFVTSSAPAQFLGKISYSVYLWHWPLVIALYYFELDKQVVPVICSIVGSLLLGYLSWRFVEQRAPNLYNKKSGDLQVYRGPIGVVVGVTCAVLVTGLGTCLTKGVPGRVTESVLLADSERKNVSPYLAKCGTHAWTTSPGCVIGGKPGHVGAIVLGDSHSESNLTAVAQAIPAGRGGVLFLGYEGCLPVPGMHKARARADFQCDAYVRKTYDRLAGDYAGVPILVISRTTSYVWGDNEAGTHQEPPIYFETRYSHTDEGFLQEFKQRYISSMCTLAKSHPVFVTLPVPEMPVDPVRKTARLLLRNGAAPQITLDEGTYRKRNAFVIETMQEAAQACGVHLLDPTPYLCRDEKCIGTKNDRPLYIDTNHLSEYGNRFLIPMFRTAFQ